MGEDFPLWCADSQLWRSALKVAKLDLNMAKGHVQQFKEISQANKEALLNINPTYDKYKALTEAQIAKHQVWFHMNANAA